ncbi:hypothetical protein M501DRAFT_988688 [Patellaria atrata CBS 101060]|uniref:Uncharacterized protein n=1 Tax=Patellaria atrata CBS 101060 TaxID=1346257 RepID=A0A9P4VUG3_9PEZI|nr:hypothetical protein M501DRAFT_988688 [Patellaria atrata CBS 101060]
MDDPSGNIIILLVINLETIPYLRYDGSEGTLMLSLCGSPFLAGLIAIFVLLALGKLGPKKSKKAETNKARPIRSGSHTHTSMAVAQENHWRRKRERRNQIQYPLAVATLSEKTDISTSRICFSICRDLAATSSVSRPIQSFRTQETGVTYDRSDKDVITGCDCFAYDEWFPGANVVLGDASTSKGRDYHILPVHSPPLNELLRPTFIRPSKTDSPTSTFRKNINRKTNIITIITPAPDIGLMKRSEKEIGSQKGTSLINYPLVPANTGGGPSIPWHDCKSMNSKQKSQCHIQQCVRSYLTPLTVYHNGTTTAANGSVYETAWFSTVTTPHWGIIRANFSTTKREWFKLATMVPAHDDCEDELGCWELCRDREEGKSQATIGIAVFASIIVGLAALGALLTCLKRKRRRRRRENSLDGQNDGQGDARPRDSAALPSDGRWFWFLRMSAQGGKKKKPKHRGRTVRFLVGDGPVRSRRSSSSKRPGSSENRDANRPPETGGRGGIEVIDEEEMRGRPRRRSDEIE